MSPNFNLISRKSEWYYVYDYIHQYCTEPFTNIHPEALLYASALLHNCLPPSKIPIGISSSNILYSLTKSAMALGANSTARLMFEKLRDRYIPPAHLNSNISIEFLDIYVGLI